MINNSAEANKDVDVGNNCDESARTTSAMNLHGLRGDYNMQQGELEEPFAVARGWHPRNRVARPGQHCSGNVQVGNT